MKHDHVTPTSSVQHAQLDPDALVDESKAAALLDVSLRALQAWRQHGGGPLFVRISSRCIRYRRCDLFAWAEARLRHSTSDVPAEGTR